MKLSDVCRDDGETICLTPEAEARTNYPIVTCNDRLREQLHLMRSVADTDSCVLISGEAGLNKQRYAEYIHRHSVRSRRPYLRFDCVSTSIAQYEKVLFGMPHDKISGEKAQHGILAKANGGTVLFDGCVFIPVSFYGKLKAAVENKSFCRSKDGKRVETNIRALATCEPGDLETLSENIRSAGSMQDRAPVHIEISALRRRPEDIALLSLHFLRLANQRCGLSKRMGKLLFHEILSYPWPGNERELQSFIERIVMVSNEDILDDPEILYTALQARKPIILPVGKSEAYPNNEGKSLREMVNEYEMMLIHQSIRQYGSLRKAALALKIAPSALSRKLAAEKKKSSA